MVEMLSANESLRRERLSKTIVDKGFLREAAFVLGLEGYTQGESKGVSIPRSAKIEHDLSS